jgi:VWFA-related protein
MKDPIQNRRFMFLHALHSSGARLRGCAIACSLLAFTAVLAAQVPQFRSRVELVHLDVSVLDNNRRPVKGLTAEDFTIYEDGKPQTVAVFNAVDLLDPPAPSTAWLRDVAPDVKRNTDVVDRRLITIVMDDATIPFDQVMIKSAREIGRQVIERLGPNDLAAIVFTRDNRNAQEFTNDRARLLKAIESFEYGGRTIGLPKPADGPVPPGLIYAESSGFLATAGTLSRVAESLADVPQRRKAVIYVGVGVPASGAASSEIAMAGNTDDPTAEIGAIARQVMDRMSQTYRKAALANVNIYTVSPAGVGGMEQLIQSERWKGRIVPTYESSMNYNEFLVGLAENTGGRAFPERNEFATALAQVFVENGSYYLLGYSPSNSTQDGRQRRLEVKVNRPDVQVRTRSGYFAEKPRDADDEAAAAPPPLTAALAGLLPKTEIGLTATAAPFAIPGKTEAGVIVVLTIDQEAAARTARTREMVDVQVNAFSQEGAPRGATRYETAVTLRPGPAGQISYEVLTSLALRPGRYQLRLSTHVGSQGKTGSVYYDLDVPDFTARALSISGLLVTSDVKPVSTDTDRIRQYVPIAPTAKRTFSVNERVSVFARIYQGGQTSTPAPVNTRSQTRMPATQGVPVQVTVTVTDAQGMVRVRRTEQVPRDGFGATDGAADFSLNLPLQNLPPGEYLFTLDAAGGRGQAVRHLRFAVQ